MDATLKERILRRLDNLSDERGYQLLDYVEFLVSKYAERSNPNNFFSRLSDTVQDTMRAGKLPISAISGTVNILDGATKVMKGVAAAAQTVVDEASKSARNIGTPAGPGVAPVAATPAPGGESAPVAPGTTTPSNSRPVDGTG